MKQYIIFVGLLYFTMYSCLINEVPKVDFTLEYYNDSGFSIEFREDGTYYFREKHMIPGGYSSYGKYWIQKDTIKLGPSILFKTDGVLLGPEIWQQGRLYYVRRCALPNQYPIYLPNGRICDTLKMWDER